MGRTSPPQAYRHPHRSCRPDHSPSRSPSPWDGTRPAAPVTNYLTYVGGKAGKANPKLSPVVIGAVNTQGGQVLVGPGWTKGAETAVQYVNRYLGGVQGHPLVLSECFTTSAEEEGTKCGQKFANDKRIKVVELGAVAVGNQSLYAALGGKKPIVGGVMLLPVDATQKNGFALFGTNDSVLGPWGTLGKTYIHAKTAAVVYPQIPGIDVGAKIEKASLEAAGIKTTLVGFDAERDRPDRAADRGRRADGRHDRPAEQRRRLRRTSRRRSSSSARAAPRSSRIRSASIRPSPQASAATSPKWIYGIASTLAVRQDRPGGRARSSRG